MVSQWIYGNDPGLDNVGKLIEACTGTCAGSDYQRSHTYDSMGRPLGAMLSINGTAGVYTLGYEAGTGRVSTLSYPSGLKVQYNYDATLGYLLSIADTSNGQVLWTVNARDAELHLQQSTAGDGVATIQVFDPATGLVEQIRASAGADDGSVADFQYGFDSNGTLMQRTDLLEGYSESFCNDALNRLTGSAVGNPGSTSCTAGRIVKSVSYDDLGNITSKSDVGTYSYSTPGSAHPHAVASVTGMVLGATNPHYQYDANGNVTCAYTGSSCTGPGILRTTDAYTSFNMLARVSQANVNIALAYDSEHARIAQQVVQVGTVANTSYYNDPMSGAFAEMVTSGTTATWHDYVVADGHIIAERFKTGTATTWNWFVLDHLGSVAVITGSDGAGGMVVVTGGRMSYDAWGRTRNADASDDTTCALPSTSPTTRGYTLQEEMPAVCLINYNARIYDPTLGRFLSPDSVTQNIYDMQLLNRFSYVGNNPLSFTDPTGHLFGIDDFFIAFVLVAILAPEIRQIPILGSLATILAGFGCGPLGPVCAGIIAAEVTGLQGGTMAQAFRAFALTTFQGEALKAIGLQKTWSLPQRALAAGMIGGITSVAGGGHFASGFLAAGLSTMAGPSVEQINSELGGTLASAVIGGVGAVLGGGKFENGAVTGAFAYVAGEDAEGEDAASGRNSSGSAAEVASHLRGGGCCYVTESMAAALAIGDASEMANFFYHEFGGSIYTVQITLPDGLAITEYGYTVYEGGANGVNYIDKSTTVAWWHTHPPGGSDSSNMFLSDSRAGAPCGPSCDIQQTMGLDSRHGTVGAFLFTPDSELRYFPDPVSSPRLFNESYYFGKGFSGN